jgi:hypothetical protein
MLFTKIRSIPLLRRKQDLLSIILYKGGEGKDTTFSLRDAAPLRRRVHRSVLVGIRPPPGILLGDHCLLGGGHGAGLLGDSRDHSIAA